MMTITTSSSINVKPRMLRVWALIVARNRRARQQCASQSTAIPENTGQAATYITQSEPCVIGRKG